MAPVYYARLTPVDQAVTDLDLLATSLRQIETGLNVYGQETLLYQIAPGDSTFSLKGYRPTFIRLGPGFQALVNRIDYLSVVSDFLPDRIRSKDMALNAQPQIDGAFTEFIGPDTVFDLTHPLLPLAFVTSPFDKPSLFVNPSHDERGSDMRLDLLLDYRIDALVDKRIDAHPIPTVTRDPLGNNKAFLLPDVTHTPRN